MEQLSRSGRRSIAPFVRGCGKSTFLEAHLPRAGDFASLGNDALAFVELLDLQDVTIVGQDWGSPTAEIVAMMRPERVSRLLKLNWYGVYSMAEMSKAQGFHYPQLSALWYVGLLNTPLGEMVLRQDRNGLAATLWKEWSPSWNVDLRGAALDSVTASFANDDWIRVALSAYRANITPAETDAADDHLRQLLTSTPPVSCATIIINRADDGVVRSPLDDAALARYFPAGVDVRPLRGVCHFPQREDPDAIAEAILFA